MGVIIGSAKNLRLRILDLKMLRFDPKKKGAENSAPFWFHYLLLLREIFLQDTG